jgi:hypothetical protein
MVIQADDGRPGEQLSEFAAERGMILIQKPDRQAGIRRTLAHTAEGNGKEKGK